MEYEILSGDSIHELTQEVCKRLADGWTLAGGVSVSTWQYTQTTSGLAGTEQEFIQAVYKEPASTQKDDDNAPVVTECPHCNREFTDRIPGERCNTSEPSGDGGTFYCPGRVKSVRQHST